MAQEIILSQRTLNAIDSIAKAINRLAKAHEDANEIEKRKVTTHSLTTVYLDDDKEDIDV